MGRSPLFSMLALPLALLIAGIVLGNIPLLIGALFILLSISISGISRTRKISVTGKIKPTSAWVGEPMEVEWVVSAEKGLGAILIRQDWQKEICKLDKGLNFRMVWKGTSAVEISHQYSVSFQRRGEHKINPPTWEAYDTLGLWPAEVSKGTSEQTAVQVLPPIVKLYRVRYNKRNQNAPETRYGEKVTLGTHTNEFKNIREYRPGDGIKNINWKATARLPTDINRPPLVNEMEQETRVSAWIFLDASLYMVTGTTLTNPLEYAITAASNIASYYLSRGYPVGIHISSRPREMLHADIGSRQNHEILQRLLNTTASGNNYELLSAIVLCYREIVRLWPHCYIITRTDTDIPERHNVVHERYTPLLAGSSHLLSLANRKGYAKLRLTLLSINALQYSEAGTDSELASRIIYLQSMPTIRAFRSKGVRVVTWHPFRDRLEEILPNILEIGSST